MSVPAALVSGDESTRTLPARDLFSRIFRRPARRRRSALGLRRRILLIFTLGSMTLSTFLAFTTYGFTRSNVVQQRDRNSVEAARLHAATVQALLAGNPLNTRAAIAALEGFGVQRGIIWYKQVPSGGSPPYDFEQVPQVLRDRVMTDSVASRMTINVGNEPTIVVGWPLQGDNAYFEFFSLDEVNSTLESIRLSLFFAGIITTGLGVLLGVFAARRAVRPVRVAAQAAKAIAGGTPRHAARTDRRPRPQRARQLVQRHGVGPAAPRRARRPIRIGRQP